MNSSWCAAVTLNILHNNTTTLIQAVLVSIDGVAKSLWDHVAHVKVCFQS